MLYVILLFSYFICVSEVNLAVIGQYVDFLVEKQGVRKIFGEYDLLTGLNNLNHVQSSDVKQHKTYFCVCLFTSQWNNR